MEIFKPATDGFIPSRRFFQLEAKLWAEALRVNRGTRTQAVLWIHENHAEVLLVLNRYHAWICARTTAVQKALRPTSPRSAPATPPPLRQSSPPRPAPDAPSLWPPQTKPIAASQPVPQGHNEHSAPTPRSPSGSRPAPAGQCTSPLISA